MENRFKRTPIVRFPSSKSDHEQDSTFWRRLHFPVTVQESGPVHRIHIGEPHPHLITVTGSTKVHLYDPQTNELFKAFTKFKDVAFGGRLRRDGQLLAVGCENGAARILDVATKTFLRTFSGHTAPVTNVRFLPDDKNLATFSDDHSWKLWDVAAEAVTSSFEEHKDYVRAGCTSNSSADIVLSGSYDHTVRLWDRRKEGSICQLDHGSPVEDLLLLPNDSILVSAGGHDIKVWDLISGGRLLARLSPHSKTITCLDFANQKRKLVSASLDGHLKFHDLSTFQTVHSVPFPSPILTAAVSPDDSFIAAGMTDGLVQFVRRKASAEEQRPAHEKSHRYMQFAQFTAKSGDLVIKEEKRGKEAKHDFFLRKFEHSKALDQVLMPYVQKRHPEYAFSVLLELKRRNALTTALGGRTEKSLSPLMSYISRYINDSRFTQLLIEVMDELLGLYGESLDGNRSLCKQFEDIRKRVERETRNVRQLLGIQGALDLILQASKSSRKPALRTEEHLLKARKEKLGLDEGKRQSLTWEKLLYE